MILPTAANADGTLTVTCEHCVPAKQVKTLAVTQIRFAKNTDGTDSPRVIQVDCPDCGSTTWHPVEGDGRCRAVVRDLFARTTQRLGSPDGKCAPGNYAAAQAYVTTEATALNAPAIPTGN